MILCLFVVNLQNLLPGAVRKVARYLRTGGDICSREYTLIRGILTVAHNIKLKPFDEKNTVCLEYRHSLYIGNLYKRCIDCSLRELKCDNSVQRCPCRCGYALQFNNISRALQYNIKLLGLEQYNCVFNLKACYVGSKYAVF